MLMRWGRSRTFSILEKDVRTRGEATLVVKEEASLGDVRAQANSGVRKCGRTERRRNQPGYRKLPPHRKRGQTADAGMSAKCSSGPGVPQAARRAPASGGRGLQGGGGRGRGCGRAAVALNRARARAVRREDVSVLALRERRVDADLDEHVAAVAELVADEHLAVRAELGSGGGGARRRQPGDPGRRAGVMRISVPGRRLSDRHGGEDACRRHEREESYAQFHAGSDASTGRKLARYFSSTVAPASSSCALTESASSWFTPSLTGFGAESTRSLASLRPRPVTARTTLITWIF